MTKSYFENVVKYILHGDGTALMCRFCYKKDNGDFLNIYDPQIIQFELGETTTTIASIYKHIVNTEVQCIDGLPQQACQKCSDDLIKHFVFEETCRQNESLLKKAYHYTKTQIKTVQIEQDSKEVKPVEFDEPDFHDYDDEDDVVVDKEPKKKFPKVPKFGMKKCTKCTEKFQTTRELYRHWKKFHPKLLPGCHECGKVFTRAYDLKVHEERHRKDSNEFHCSQCEKQFKLERTLKEHIKHAHGEKTISCSQCPAKFATKTMLCRHKYGSHRPKKELKCQKCEQTFWSRWKLRAHMVAEHEFKYEVTSEAFMCDICGKILLDRFKLKVHKNRCEKKRSIKQETDNTVFTCSICGAVRNSKRNLLRHISGVHTQKSFPCSVCAKLFKTSAQVKSHMIVHTRERKHRCEACKKDFVSGTSLLYHNRLHTGEKPYACETCGECFLSSSRRLIHMRKKHWGPQFVCEICNNKYYTPFHLKRHLKRHFNPNSKLKMVIAEKPVEQQGA